MKVWIDGELSDGAQAKISVRDHGLLYGDGVFEGIRVCAGRPFKLSAHLARLGRGARALHLRVPGGEAHLREVVTRTLAAYGESEAYMRLIVTRGDGPLGVDPTSCEAPRVICLIDRIQLYSDDKRAAGLSMITSSVRRPSADVLDPRIKTLNYLNNVLAKGEARRQGADEALLLNQQGQIAEASVANVFAVHAGRLSTPPTSDGALDGITRATVLELAQRIGLACEVRTLGRIDLFGADEVFLTGTGAGLVRVRSLDGEPIGTGPWPITARLSAALEAERATSPA
jgi:branched-chain amino acid aminotransferase